jgi:hypothetical protein
MKHSWASALQVQMLTAVYISSMSLLLQADLTIEASVLANFQEALPFGQGTRFMSCAHQKRVMITHKRHKTAIGFHASYHAAFTCHADLTPM